MSECTCYVMCERIPYLLIKFITESVSRDIFEKSVATVKKDIMSSVSSSSTGATQRWNQKNLEILTLSVEKTLEPLVIQVTTLVNTKGPSNKKKGKSRSPKVGLSLSI